MNKTLLFKQTFGHFCVDAVSATIVISNTKNLSSVIYLFILYNFLAFCLQPFFGLLLDRVRQISPRSYILISFVLLILGFIPYLNIWTCIFLVGLGNCLFHTGAGTLILSSSQNKMGPLGIFVSAGALGLTFGTLLENYLIVHTFLILSLLVLFLLNLNLSYDFKEKTNNKIYWIVASFLCLCIAIRSFMGFVPVTNFEKYPMTILMITFGVFLGKNFGGFLCDKFGIQRVVVISTLVVMVLFLFTLQNPFLWTIVQIIINFSMPITLYLMYKSMPKYPAFSFGLSASCLVIGLIAALVFRKIYIPPACFLILFMINSFIIIWAERKLKWKK